MAESHWHICGDCLDPLSDELFSIVGRLGIYVDFAAYDQLLDEWRQLSEKVGWTTKKLRPDDRKRLDEVSRRLAEIHLPADDLDLELLYRRLQIDRAVSWLKFHVSVDYGTEFERILLWPKSRFDTLAFKASQIIHGDEGRESTTKVRYAIDRVIDGYYKVLHERFPGHQHQPTGEELPDDLRAFEVEILDEYAGIQNDLREAAEHVARVSAYVRSPGKAGKAGTDNVAHSDDFRSVRSFGESFAFTPTQAACVQILWRNWEQGTPVIGEVTGNRSRLF